MRSVLVLVGSLSLTPLVLFLVGSLSLMHSVLFLVGSLSLMCSVLVLVGHLTYNPMLVLMESLSHLHCAVVSGVTTEDYWKVS